MSALIELLRTLADPAPSSSAEAGDPMTPARFLARGSLPLDQISVHIEDFGPLPQPLPRAAAQRLQALSTPARFGLREKTLLDASVRHTGEIDADQIELRWAPGVFAALQRDVARALGVEQLEAWLHNLLIYGPGQFFKPHQDTEKYPGMVATLVLVWPSPHIGGTLKVQQGQQVDGLVSQHLQLEELRWFAFYADCRHEVLPVEEGWRVVLTFDLVVPKQVPQSAPALPQQDAMTAALQAQFGLDNPAPSLQPWVLLLDHEYTEHGLRWPLLKGVDRRRTGLLRAAAATLGLRVHLALVEWHESWSAEPTYTSRRRYPQDEASRDDMPQPVDLIDRDLALDFWVDAEDRVGPRSSLRIPIEVVASFIETGEQHLVDQQYEGYMGNYGETLDYWYRRAALVIRTPLADERDRFELDFDAALADLVELARRVGSDPDSAAALAARTQAASSQLHTQARQREGGLLASYAEIGLALPGPAALTLLQSFVLTRLTPQDAAALAGLTHRHGVDWLRALLQHWHTPQAGSPEWHAGGYVPQQLPRLWPTPLPAFVAAAQQANWPIAALTELLAWGLRQFISLGQACAQTTPVRRQQHRPGLLLLAQELAQALVLCGADDESGLQVLINHLLSSPLIHPVESLQPLVDAVGPIAGRWPLAVPLRTQVITALRQALAQPERDPADHRLRNIAWTCRCSDCSTMIIWAELPGAEPLAMAMAEARRNHVQTKLTDAAAPLLATTLRQGSPHRLVLRKPADLLAQEHAERVRWARDLAALAG